MSPEAFILAVNATIALIAYLYVYPRFAGTDLQRLSINDLVANLAAVGIAAYFFAGSGTRFSLGPLEVGWFAFTVVTFLLIELPLFVGYARRYGVFRKEE